MVNATIENTCIISYNGIEVYSDDISICESEYINSLPDPNNIYKSTVFSGLLDYIYKRLLKNVIVNNTGYNNSSYDYNVLDDIFSEIYIPLTTKYNINPTVLQYATCLIHVDNTNLSDVKNGTYRSNGAKVNPNSTQIVKKWYSRCEAGLLSRVANEQSIGSMFILKSKYGYQEQAQKLEIVSNGTQSTPEQIAERYKDIKKPEIPVLEEL